LNLSDLSSLLILIGILVVVYPLTVMFFQFDSPLWFFKVTMGVGSALIGAGIGLGVGDLVYRKEIDGINDE